MSAIEVAFSSATRSLDWAEEGISEFDTICREFFEDAQHSFVTDVEPATGQQTLKFCYYGGPLPSLAVRRATENIRNIKDSFDQAMFAARNILVGPSSKTIYFPWAQTPVDLEHRLSKGKIPAELWSTIRDFQPYPRSEAHPGGDDTIRSLAQIGGKMKHTVHLVVSPDIVSVRLPTITSGANVSGTATISIPVWDPEENELKIVDAPRDYKIHNDASVVMNVCFDEPSLRGIQVVGSSRYFLERARNLVGAFKSICKGKR